MRTKKPELPDFASDKEAEDFVASSDLSDYDLSAAKRHRFNVKTSKHKFEVVRDAKGEYRIRFKVDSEVIFATEGYASKLEATRAIESIRRHAATATIGEGTEWKASEKF